MINIREPKGDTTRATLKRIAKRNGTDISGAARIAASFMDAAERTAKPEMDMATMTNDELRTMTIHGYDFYTRAAALDTMLARLGEAAK
jgi:hypothetical protein